MKLTRFEDLDCWQEARKLVNSADPEHKLRVVIDTNVLISALFWVGRPKRLLNLVRSGKIDFITSEPCLQN